MGITGLLPFVKKATRTVHVREFSGCTAAVDAYCWLHRGAFGCAEQLATGRQTDAYVGYCLRLTAMLQQHGVKPLLVFDGGRLPSKHVTEKQRRQRRDQQRALAADHLAAGRDRQARECFQRCVDITPQMALALISACRQRNIDCIVAPYEADAQLAYMARHGMVDLVITEDSDLVVFGCERVLFKMDSAGGGQLVERHQLHLALGQSADKLRLIAVLAGCDYLPSLPGVGLGRASRVFVRAANTNWRAIVDRLPTYLGMRSLCVPPDYSQEVERALNTFSYQLVFDPRQRRLVPLTPYPPGCGAADYPYAGAELDNETALQIAIGNVDPMSGQVMADFDLNSSKAAAVGSKSIWSVDYVPKPRSFSRPSIVDQLSTGGRLAVTRQSTEGRRLSVNVPSCLLHTSSDDKNTDRAQSKSCLSESHLLGLYGAGDTSNPTRGDEAASLVCSNESFQSGRRIADEKGVTAADDGGFVDDGSACADVSAQPGLSQQSTCTAVDDSAVESQSADSGIGTEEQPLSPVVGGASNSAAGSLQRNPFRVRGPVANQMLANRRKATDGESAGVTSKYFAREEGATTDDTAVVNSLEEILRERRVRRSSLAADSAAARKRQRLTGAFSTRRLTDEGKRRLSTAEVASKRSSGWYKISSVFDPKHSMTVTDGESSSDHADIPAFASQDASRSDANKSLENSEICSDVSVVSSRVSHHALLDSTSSEAAAPAPEEDITVLAVCRTPAKAVLSPQSSPRLPSIASARRRVVGKRLTGTCTLKSKIGSSRRGVSSSGDRKTCVGRTASPCSGRQLNLQQMFGYRSHAR